MPMFAGLSVFLIGVGLVLMLAGFPAIGFTLAVAGGGCVYLARRLD